MKGSLEVAALCVLLAIVPAARAQGGSLTAFTTLTGSKNVPAVNTPASGNCSIAMSGNSGSYNTSVSNVMNLQVVHIHIGNLSALDVTPAVLILYSSTPPATIQGTKTVPGTFTATDLKGNLTGSTLDALGNLFTQGLLYCDVHVSPANPADKPPSLIRGQFAAQRTGAVAPAPAASAKKAAPSPAPKAAPPKSAKSA